MQGMVDSIYKHFCEAEFFAQGEDDGVKLWLVADSGCIKGDLFGPANEGVPQVHIFGPFDAYYSVKFNSLSGNYEDEMVIFIGPRENNTWFSDDGIQGYFFTHGDEREPDYQMSV